MLSLLTTLLGLPLLALTTPLPILSSSHPNLLPRQDVQTPFNASLPTVSIFATGGTIASQGSSTTQTIGYSIGLGVSDLITAVPELLSIANINGYQVSNVGSGSINATILLDLARRINAEVQKEEVSGVVVTHGTDTLEETCFWLELVVETEKPVVCVGAMRPATALSADGPLNLVQGVTLAGSTNARGRGSMIVLNDRIGSAFYTTKNHANALDTFYSAEAGQLGFFINQVPYFYFSASRPIGRSYFSIPEGLGTLPQVDILYAHQDLDPTLFGAAVTAGAQGIVVAGVGAGGFGTIGGAAVEAARNATGVMIVASHRSADGFVPDDGEGTIGSGFYNPQKARILLQLALASGMETEEVREVFARSYPSPDA